MTVKVIILVIISIAVGVGAVLGLMFVLNTVYHANVNVEEFGYGFAFLTGFPIALAAAVWLDFFLGTHILPE